MADDDIVQTVKLEGEDEVVAAFDRIAQAGADAMSKIGDASESAAEPTGAIKAAADRAGVSIAAMRARIDDAKRSGEQFGATAKVAAEATDTAAVAATGAAVAHGALHESFLKANTSGRNFAVVLQQFGRITHERDITQLARAVRLLSSGLSALAVPVGAVFLDRIGAAAAASAVSVDDLALKNKLGSDEFQNLAAAGTAAGISTDDFSKSLDAVKKLLKETADNTKQYTDQQRGFTEKTNEGRNKLFEMTEALADVRTKGTRAIRDLADEQSHFNFTVSDSSRSFAIQLRNIQEARQAIINNGVDPATARIRALRDNDEQEKELIRQRAETLKKQAEDQTKLNEKAADETRNRQKEVRKLLEQEAKEEQTLRDTAKAAADAAAAFERNRTPLDKLGIDALDVSGKLKKTPEVLLLIADKLAGMEEGEKKLGIQSDLVAAGLNSKLLPALNGGAAAFQKFIDRGKEIRPPFTKDEIDTARKFQIASTNVVDALASLKDQFGIAVAPAFITFLEDVLKFLEDIRPGIKEFGTVLGEFLKPALAGIVSLLNNVIKPAFSGLVTLFQLIATKINETFGTKISGMELLVGTALAIAAAFGGLPLAITAVTIALGLFIEKIKDNKLVVGLVVTALAGLAIILGSVPLAVAAVLLALGFVVAQWEKISTGAKDAWEIIKAAFQAGVKFAVDTWEALKQAVLDGWDKIKEKADEIWEAIKQSFANAGERLRDLFNAVIQLFVDGWEAIKQGASDAWDAMVEKAEAALNSIKDFFDPVIKKAKELWGWLKSVFSAQAEAQQASDGTTPPPPDQGPGFARGGSVHGPGSTTSDSILARLSRGEFVHKARAVAHYGVRTMRAINNMQVPAEALQRFAGGGLVEVLRSPLALPAFAGGGLVPAPALPPPSGGRPVVLDFGGKDQFHLSTDQNTAESLGKYAVQRRVASSGRKATYFGNGR